MGPVRTFRSPFGRVLAVGMAAVATLSLVSTASLQGAAGLLHSGGVPTLAAVIVWAMFWRPALQVSDGGLTVVGVLRTTHVPWPCLTKVERTWALRLMTTDGPVSVWAVPARGVAGARAASRAEDSGVGTIPGLGGVDADAVAGEIERRWSELADAGYLAAPVSGAVHLTITWHGGTIVGIAALAGWVWLGTTL